MASRLGAPWDVDVGDPAGAGAATGAGAAGGAAGVGDVVLGRGGKLGGKTGWATVRQEGCFQDCPDGSAGKSFLNLSRKIRALPQW